MDETDVRKANKMTKLERQRVIPGFRAAIVSKSFINPAVASIAKGIVMFCKKRL